MYIFGLGNPGKEYDGTRHNVGFMAIDKIASHYGVQFKKKTLKKYFYASINDGKDVLIKPLTYMNTSGSIIPSLIRNKEKLLVICDQMDLPVGSVKIKRNGGSAGHKGLKSIIENYGEDFIHVYVGIDHPASLSVPDYVLSRFSQSEKALIDKATDKVRDAVIRILDGEELGTICESVNRKEQWI